MSKMSTSVNIDRNVAYSQVSPNQNENPKMSDQDITDIPTSPEKGKYEFDFYALSKIKRQERQKIVCLTAVICLLLVVAIAFIIMFIQCNRDEELEKKAVLNDAKVKAYKRIAKYGEDCSKDYLCGKNAFCRHLQGTYRCDCVQGFYGDGIGDCKSGFFGISFEKETTKNIPIVRGIEFPATDSMSICFWMLINEKITSRKAVFSYVSHDIEGENALTLWLNTDNKMSITFRNQEITVTGPRFSFHSILGRWSHVCWVWHFKESWEFYVNTKLYMNSANSHKLKESFPKSTGDVILGQALQNGQISMSQTAFIGKITELFIYNIDLTHSQIKAAFQHYPHDLNISVGWWKFHNLTRGTDIKEINYPFSHKFFISRRKK